jgi:hypothetical protein
VTLPSFDRLCPVTVPRVGVGVGGKEGKGMCVRVRHMQCKRGYASGTPRADLKLWGIAKNGRYDGGLAYFQAHLLG